MSASWITSLQTFLGNALGRVEELEKKLKEEGEAADKARADSRRLRVEKTVSSIPRNTAIIPAMSKRKACAASSAPSPERTRICINNASSRGPRAQDRTEIGPLLKRLLASTPPGSADRRPPSAMREGIELICISDDEDDLPWSGLEDLLPAQQQGGPEAEFRDDVPYKYL